MVYRRTEQYGCIYAIVLYLPMTMYKAMTVFVKERNHKISTDPIKIFIHSESAANHNTCLYGGKY